MSNHGEEGKEDDIEKRRPANETGNQRSGARERVENGVGAATCTQKNSGSDTRKNVHHTGRSK